MRTDGATYPFYTPPENMSFKFILIRHFITQQMTHSGHNTNSAVHLSSQNIIFYHLFITRNNNDNHKKNKERYKNMSTRTRRRETNENTSFSVDCLLAFIFITYTTIDSERSRKKSKLHRKRILPRQDTRRWLNRHQNSPNR